MTTGLYIHIPFCRARCGYCDFVTFTGKEDRIDHYVDQLCREADLHPAGLALDTVFFGGGTPSLLTPAHLERLLGHWRRRFAIAAGAEITMEANPESLTLERAEGWRAAGVNRLSIGLQAMDDALLKTMDRLHTVDEFLAAYRAARQAGFDNLNVDLIYGFTAQSMTAWQDTVEKTLALRPEHISMYALVVEEHTPFAAQGVRTNEDLQGEMYAWARERLPAAGYPQYEISNFAQTGRECRHNLIYWRQQDYLALGVGAVGCLGSLRWTNHKTMHAYDQNVDAGKLPRLVVEPLDNQTRQFERLMLGLRLREGLAWGDEPNPVWRSERERLRREGLLEETRPGHWRVSDGAVPFTNKLLLPFVQRN